MTTTRERARELAIEAAKQDPDLHTYTLPVRTLQPWEPHTWVVNAIAKALDVAHAAIGTKGVELITGIVDKHVERIDRRITTIVDSVTERLRALEGTGDRTSSPARTSVVDVLNLVRDTLVRVTELEGVFAPRRLNELDARCDALAARIDLLEAGRTGPREITSRAILATSDDPDRMAQGMTDALVGATKKHPLRAFYGEGNPSVFPPGVADPTTEAIAARTADLERARDRIATLEKLLDARDDHHNATMAKLEDATALLDEIAKVCDVQPIGSRQHNAAAILRWLEVHKGASKLSETEWNRLRERVNPIIAPQFSGQDIGDALVNTVQLLEARVRHAFDEERARCETITQRDEDNAAIAIKLKDATDRLAELQGKHAGRLRLLEDQQAQVTELRGEVVRLRTIVDETTYSLDAADAPARTPLPMRVDVVLRQLADARKAIAEVWALVADRDGHGSPFYTEPDQHESVADAVSHVLAHLRDKLVAAEASAKNYAETARQHMHRATDLLEAKSRLEALHKNQHETLADGAKLKAERDEAREHAAMFDVDRCNLRMDLDVAQATIKRMQPFVDAGQKAVGILHYDARPHPTLVAFMEAGEAYENACAKAADIGLGNEDEIQGSAVVRAE